jgi:2-succinyl-6-hydroxy-2,4-cyclohexadiene-1-carboxylate synthase
MATAPLHADRRGSGPRIVLVHGFTQTRRCWGPAAEGLAVDHEVVSIDAPGHGRSGHDDAGLWASADLLAATGGRGTWIGYSMGARLALHVALARPEVVERLVLIGATPGLRLEAERRARIAADEQLARKLEAEGVEAFIDDWLALPLFVGLTAEQACRAERLENRVEGLAASLRSVGTGQQEPLWDRLGAIPVPVLWVTGELDVKFGAIADEAADHCPLAQRATIADASHTAHLEQPARFEAEVRRFLDDPADEAQADR